MSVSSSTTPPTGSRRSRRRSPRTSNGGWQSTTVRRPPSAPARGRPIVLFGSTFTPRLAAAPVLLDAIAGLVRRGDRYWLLTLHPKTAPAWFERYRALAGEHARGDANLVAAHADADAREREAVVGLAPDRAFLALQHVVEQPLPVERGDQLLDLVDGHAGRIERADERAHAGAGDAVDLYAAALELAQHGDVGDAARAAAAEREANARPRVAGRAFATGDAVVGERERRCEQRDAAQPAQQPHGPFSGPRRRVRRDRTVRATWRPRAARRRSARARTTRAA